MAQKEWREKITSKIIATYLSHLQEFPPYRQRHFVYRASLIYQSPQLRQALQQQKEYLRSLIPAFEEYLDDPESKIPYIKQRLKEYRCRKINDRPKLEQWKKLIEVRTHHPYLWLYFYFRRLLKLNKKKWTLRLKSLAQPIHQKILNHPNFVRYAPVTATNIFFLHAYLGILDQRAEYIRLFRKIFQKVSSSDALTLTNYIYGLTHIVIGDSCFYAYWPDRENLAWTIEQFDRDQTPR
ncbi:MAG: DUF3541 domain-containing protein [Firmicutes bacterium]|nr:DUF3541 domain-containing protein [Bacillota bacterium]